MKKLIINACAAALFLLACGKSEVNGNMSVSMTDASGPYEKVLVEVVSVEAHYESGHSENDGWQTLPTNAGIYDLLELRNNATVTLVDNSKLPLGKINQMRLILGSHNTVVVQGASYDLKIPSSANTGIKINVNTNINANNHVVMLLDFDADKSVNLLGNNEYQMTPVITLKSLTQ